MTTSSERQPRRGQALVETALLLPLLLVLLVMAIDFGRVFFGWVALTNLSRIAADFAATHPDAWSTGDAADLAEYERVVLRDAAAINCQLAALPEPAFDPDPPVLGGDARVDLVCRFQPITPIVGAIVGSPLEIGASSIFPVRGGCPTCPPPPAGAGPTPTPTPAPLATPTPPPDAIICPREPNLFGLSVAGARNEWTWAGFTGTFTPTTGDDGRTVTGQTVNNAPDADGCLPHWTTMTVTFTPLPDPPDPACSGLAYVPSLLSMTVGNAKTLWTASGFTGAFLPEGLTGNLVVTSQTIGPTAAAPDACVDPASTVTVATKAKPKALKPTCKTPNFANTASTDAQATWTAGGFSTTVAFLYPELLPYTIKTQSVVGGSWVVCTTGITLGPEPPSP